MTENNNNKCFKNKTNWRKNQKKGSHSDNHDYELYRNLKIYGMSLESQYHFHKYFYLHLNPHHLNYIHIYPYLLCLNQCPYLRTPNLKNPPGNFLKNSQSTCCHYDLLPLVLRTQSSVS